MNQNNFDFSFNIDFYSKCRSELKLMVSNFISKEENVILKIYRTL